jgi:hypothetical protein
MTQTGISIRGKASSCTYLAEIDTAHMLSIRRYRMTKKA